MNVKYINPLLESTISVLATMAMVQAKPGKPSLKQGQQSLGDVTGMIDLAGQEVNGSLAIGFSEPAILDIAEKMLGERVSVIDDTVLDVVGEITNMITGSAKRLYSEQGIEFDLTLPSIWSGNDKIIEHKVKGNPIILPFDTTAGQFYLELCFS
ncbi:MAG: chemotaxis protein CheX [Oceanicoccus sp.]|uniref:chemotaxis protein CheX n=1 Tax=Oceanicoccus sp. TaxID=2691044 RepID=UPI002613E277|nr:chemotaxis protein CheX [Oceanicoccus sp.]MCP3909040.1 chemotaxis protein CheX [Oceanicoccus sp.]MDG1772509.1 chemotaxis protein CheX [Oceanicoccus sp.]